jgi:hypothetical protein
MWYEIVDVDLLPKTTFNYDVIVYVNRSGMRRIESEEHTMCITKDAYWIKVQYSRGYRVWYRPFYPGDPNEPY